MMQNKNQQETQPGVLATLAAGFDLTAKHLWLILLPIFLDIFLWIGPRLSLGSVIERMIAMWPQDPALAGMEEQLLALAPQTNLFTSLSVPFLGTPALMSGVAPAETPLTPPVFELYSVGWWPVLFVGFSLLGLGLTAVYLTSIAAAVREEAGWSSLPIGRRALTVWRRLLLAAFAFLAAMLILMIPIFLVAMLAALLSPLLSSLILLLGPFIGVWVLLTCFFAPQGLTLYGRSVREAIGISLYLLRYHARTGLGLILAVLLGKGLLQQVLRWTDDGSWLTLGTITGHAFVSTALIAATFLFYRDRVRPAVQQET